MSTNKVKVGILGATGAVGQRFVQLLHNHPWFEIVALGASERSAGMRYGDRRWVLRPDMPERMADMTLRRGLPENFEDCKVIFSALPSSAAGPTEPAFAAAGYALFSNAGAHRMDDDIPLMITEVNPDHASLIKVQQEGRGWPGFIVTNANCSSTHLTSVLKPLQDAFGLDKVLVVTMQAVSGAGYPGVSSMDILDNVVPYIDNEEPKLELEPRKMLGRLVNGSIELADFTLSAHCNRVPTLDGHLECVSLSLKTKATEQDIDRVLRTFRALPQELSLPSAPDPVIIVRDEPDRPQPRLDRMAGNGMATVVGRIRPCPILQYKLVLLGHNTVRGAAGGSVLNAELFVHQGLIG
ncbi:MAG: aspartate-semialdehyde dehydrogenase [Chloroflexota bacterium]|nr:aspartate-semialdehyde dehydrogenase [Chloroflexota bacterium]